MSWSENISVIDWVPTRINQSSLLTSYTWPKLRDLLDNARIALPICGFGTRFEQLSNIAELVLPPLYIEALDSSLADSLVERVKGTFPYLPGTKANAHWKGSLEVVRVAQRLADRPPRGKLIGFSVDTAVEQHGPHLPLATDTIQSYAVLSWLAEEVDDFLPIAPLDYGHLTWGLPIGMSVDLGPELLERYVASFAAAVVQWAEPRALYVVDVHGSPVHRAAIVAGLERAALPPWKFRWLHEPLVPFAAERGDQHAGAVETALIESIDPALLDSSWWPVRIEDLQAGQMEFERALELSGDLRQFISVAEQGCWNGIVGRMENYSELNSAELWEWMIAVALSDLDGLLSLA